MAISAGYVPAATENDPVKLARSIRNLFENGSDATAVAALIAASTRPILTANRTYYVRTDGSDSNTGLENTAGGAFLTIQKALDVVAALDIGIYTVTINVGAGTYNQALTVTGPWVGSGTVALTGDTTTPTNVIITSTSPTNLGTLTLLSGARLTLGGFQVKSVTAGFGIRSADNCVLNITGAMDFGATAAGYSQLFADGGRINISANYTISAAPTGGTHINSSNVGSLVQASSITVTLSGTPAFGIFAFAFILGEINYPSVTFSGSATGQRYNGQANAVVSSNGGGANYFPGNVAGAVTTGAQYL